MNILGLVFSLILILSYGFFASWEKQNSSHRLRSMYLSHQTAQRKILNQYEGEIYNRFRSKPNPSESKEKAPAQPAESEPELNRECARLNLFPLMQDAKQPFLYETAAKLLRTFYGKNLFGKHARFEYKFLDQFLLAASQSKEPRLEKLVFKDPEMQKVYYKMLKGTKEWNVAVGLGYPSLLDYVKIEAGTDKLCLFHAHPDLLTVLFNPNAASKLFQDLHKDPVPPITRELIEKVCLDAHLIAVDPELFALLEMGHAKHGHGKNLTFIEEDESTHLSLKKNIRIDHL